MGVKITKGKNYDQTEDDTRCKSCAGSGYYDWANPKTGKVPKCAACSGTGEDS